MTMNMSNRSRQSNFECLRIVAMMMVVLLHCNYYALSPVRGEDVLNAPVSSFVRILTEQLCFICVNVFILISGWFGLRPTIKGGGALIFQVFFWGALILILGVILNVPLQLKSVLQVFYFGAAYWFIPAYLLLYILSPILNQFIENSNPHTIFATLFSFFVFEFALGWEIDFAKFDGGLTTISFIGLYLLARYVRLYSNKLSSLSVRHCLLLYLVLSVIPSIIAFGGLKYFGTTIVRFTYTSPFVVAASLFFMLAFSKMYFHSRTINWLACSAFSIFLAHQHPIVTPYFIGFMRKVYSTVSGIEYMAFAIIYTLILCTSCMLIDKVRIICWQQACRLILDKFFQRIELTFEKIYNICK